MADSDNAASLPEGMDLYASYIDGQAVEGQPESYAAACARFGADKCISISVDGNPAQAGDVERGALTIQQAIVIGYPMLYCSLSNWAVNKAAVAAAGKPQPLWWVAGYATPPDPTIPAGAAGHQYTDGTGAYDTSVMADYLPGIDPAPVPQEDDVKPIVIGVPTEGVFLFVPASPPYRIHLPTAADVEAMEYQYGAQQAVTQEFAATIPTFPGVVP